MSFFSKIIDKTKDLLGISASDEQKLEKMEESAASKRDKSLLDTVHSQPAELYYPSNTAVETDIQKIIADFELKHPWACELFMDDVKTIKDESDNVETLTRYWNLYKSRIDLYNNCIRDILKINYVRSQISVKLKPEIIFEVQGTVQENIELIKDLTPYVIKLFIYDCKKLFFTILEVLHLCKKEIGISKKSIADDFVNKIALSITQRIREILAVNFAKEGMESTDKITCNELLDLTDIAQGYKNISKSNRNISFTLDDLIDDKYCQELSNHIDKVIARYENRHIVDKIKDYAVILWYVLRFFYSIFFGAGFLYLIWLGKNLNNLGNNIDSFFLKAGDLLNSTGDNAPSELIAPLIAAALSKITIILVILSIFAIIVYFAYRVYSVRNKLSDIVNLNISIYAASLFDISIYKCTDKLIRDISLEVQGLLEIPRERFIYGSMNKNEPGVEERLDDRHIALYIERVNELKTLCERLIASAQKK